MRIVLQRVSQAYVRINGNVYSSIDKGLLIFIGIHKDDRREDVVSLIKKILSLRIFPDAANKMNHSVRDVKGELLIISQFTLYAAVNQGNRPSFSEAAKPGQAEMLYSQFIEEIKVSGLKVATGVFGAHMNVELINDGPVTIILDSGGDNVQK